MVSINPEGCAFSFAHQLYGHNSLNVRCLSWFHISSSPRITEESDSAVIEDAANPANEGELSMCIRRWYISMVKKPYEE